MSIAPGPAIRLLGVRFPLSPRCTLTRIASALSLFHLHRVLGLQPSILSVFSQISRTSGSTTSHSTKPRIASGVSQFVFRRSTFWVGHAHVGGVEVRGGEHALASGEMGAGRGTERVRCASGTSGAARWAMKSIGSNPT